MASSPDQSLRIPINIIFYTPSKIVNTKSFSPHSTFKEILDYYRNEIQPKEKLTRLFKQYSINDKPINEGDTITTYLPKNILLALTEINFAIELKELFYIDKTLQLDQIIKPKTNPFGLIVYEHNSNLIKFEEYPEKIIKKYDLEYFTESSAYCNSENVYIYLVLKN